MSFQAMAWAVKQKTESPISKLILLMICNYADEEGNCYPSQEHLADLCQCSRVSVNKHIQELRKKNYISIIKKANGQFVYNNYHVNMLNIGFVNNIDSECKPVLHNTIKNTINNKPTLFDVFWNHCPKKIGKKKTKDIYTKIINNKKIDVTEDELIKGILLYKESVIEIESKYICHPSTWLNQGRWEDEFPQTTRKNKNWLAG
jgi:DNA-binding transcriptional regulator YhcF (GntR family)